MKTDLRSEAKAPFRFPRLYFLFGLGIGSAIGLVFLTSREEPEGQEKGCGSDEFFVHNSILLNEWFDQYSLKISPPARVLKAR